MATRLQIRTRARIRADQDDSTFPDDTEYNYLIDEAVKDVWYDLIQAGWPINFAAATKTATGSNPITLGISGTVAFIRGVYYINGSTFDELKRVNEGDRASLMSRTGGPATHYDVRIDPTNGPVLELLPLPSSGSYRVEYITEHPGLASDVTEWYGPARSDELVVLCTAAKAMRKEGNDQGAQQVTREYGYMLDKVQAMASWFDMRNSGSIRDVGPLEMQRGDFDYDV
jgi:hypothetical protein